MKRSNAKKREKMRSKKKLDPAATGMYSQKINTKSQQVHKFTKSAIK
jgi:hypothetical protein